MQSNLTVKLREKKPASYDMKLPIQTIDLFSGIGGITKALQGIIQPVAYCEIGNMSQCILSKNMHYGVLPKAPICPDVNVFNRTWFQKHCPEAASPRMIVGGFPCVGFSPCGKRHGFKERQSSLFYQMLRVVD
jgi:site-specific DNA-cytosine methylase